MKPFEMEKQILPEYPRTQHLPFQPNATRDDLIASEKEAAIIFSSPYVYIDEKVDGAALAVTWLEDGPLIRNRNHILRKGYRKETPAKLQFASTWSWMYDQKDKFEKLAELAGDVSVYGEWLLARHSIHYDKLPSYFLTFDLFDHQEKKFIDPGKARTWLEASGFDTTPLLHYGLIKKYQDLTLLINHISNFSSNIKREGLYFKVSDGEWVTHRFKIVRSDFIAGEHWSKTQLVKNKLANKV